MQVDVQAATNVLDRWITAASRSLTAFVRREMGAYRLYTVVPFLVPPQRPCCESLDCAQTSQELAREVVSVCVRMCACITLLQVSFCVRISM